MVNLLGVALIVREVVALAYEGITYTTREKVLDVGPLKVEVKREKTIPPLGVAALAGGIVLRSWPRVGSSPDREAPRRPPASPERRRRGA